MKIAYIINSVEGGGAALPVPSVIRVLSAQGFAVEVLALTRRDGRALAAIEAAGVQVRVRDGGEKDHWAALRWIDGEVARMRPDALWTSLTRATLLGQIVGLRRRLPVVSWQHAAFLKPANRRLLRLMKRRTCLWVADSASVAELSRERLGLDRAQLMTWPIFRADPDAPRAAAWKEGERLRIGSLGRLHPVKGYDVLIDALALLGELGAQIEVRVAGDGTERATLEQQVAEARAPGDAARVCRRRTGISLARQHLYVQPSRSEGLCVAVHQAMAAGLPVIASAVGELPNSIDPACGRTVPPGDAASLAEAIRALVAAPDQLSAMGAAARQRVLHRFGPRQFDEAGAAVSARLRAILAERATSVSSPG